MFSSTGFEALLSFAIDFAGIGSVIAALTALIALYFGYRNNKRTASNTESVSYVDNNLKTMQATLDWLTADNARLRKINEEQRVQSLGFIEELHDVEQQLLECKNLCSAMNKRLNELGEKNAPARRDR